MGDSASGARGEPFPPRHQALSDPVGQRQRSGGVPLRVSHQAGFSARHRGGRAPARGAHALTHGENSSIQCPPDAGGRGKGGWPRPPAARGDRRARSEQDGIAYQDYSNQADRAQSIPGTAAKEQGEPPFHPLGSRAVRLPGCSKGARRVARPGSLIPPQP